MKEKAISILIAFALVSLLSFTSFISAPRKWYSFEIILPEIVEGKPGEVATVNGGILNTGLYWLRAFNISLSGLPYRYEIEPSFFESVRILREWDPEKGVYRVPVNFTIKIYLPENASGIYLVNVTGTEGSWRKISSSSSFILRVFTNVTIQPNVSISELELPETVRENQTFNLTFKINNFEPIDLKINASIIVPEGWKVEDSKSVLVKAKSSEKLSFDITPAKTSGNVVIFIEYPYGARTFNLTRYGAFLVPQAEIEKAEKEKVEKPEEVPSITARIIEQIKGISPIILAIAILLVLIIIWNIAKIYQFYRTRKVPEKMEKPRKKESQEKAQSQTQFQEPSVKL
jgi:hypothetical protein